MTVYREKEHISFKWIIGAIIFILAMTVTFSDVYGFNFPNRQNNNPAIDDYNNSNCVMDYDDETCHEYDPEKPPEDIPEPSTIILLAAGLSGLYLKKRKSLK
ncbi:MAG: PEP-CTERM sorting domain-containing protein [Candidatus Zixiibacteriota bacterium]